MLNLIILMEMKPEKYIEAYPLRDALYWNLGMVLNGQGLSQHPVSDVMCHDLGIVTTRKDQITTSLVVRYVSVGE